MRTKSYLRHQRKRVISKKINIIKSKNFSSEDFTKGKLSKGKIHCSCSVCKYEKHFKIRRYNEETKFKAIKEGLILYLEELQEEQLAL